MILYEVSGSFILPGTRDKLSFGPVRVLGKNRTEASAGLVGSLNEAFSKELRSMPRVAFQQVGFSKSFALYHLTWKQVEIKQGETVKDIAINAMAAIPHNDSTDPPALNA